MTARLRSGIEKAHAVERNIIDHTLPALRRLSAGTPTGIKVAVGVFAVGAAAAYAIPATLASGPARSTRPSSEVRAQIIDEAESQLGVPYCWGSEAPAGTAPKGYRNGNPCSDNPGYPAGYPVYIKQKWTSRSGGFDNSGLVDWAVSAAGVKTFGTYGNDVHGLDTAQQWAKVQQYLVAKPSAGDLVFFTSGSNPQPTFVGICAIPNCNAIVAAPATGGVVANMAIRTGEVTSKEGLAGYMQAEPLANGSLTPFGKIAGYADLTISKRS